MRILIVVALLLNGLFANEYLESIYQNILLKNTQKAIDATNTMVKSIKAQNKQQIKDAFTGLVKSWKSVEAFYVLGDLDGDYIDTPRYIDVFHQGNEDLHSQLQRVVQSSDDISISLFKNSYKTINALEYILFAQDIKDQRVKELALEIVKSIKRYLTEILNGYEQNEKKFTKDEQTANSMILNALIETTYKLSEWRVGNPAGLSRKYKGDPDNSRAEYLLSKNSFNAIDAIIQTNLDIMGKRDYKNFGSLIRSYGIKEELQNAITHLQKAQLILLALNKDDFSKAKPLYKELKKVHLAYYITLIGKLKVTAKVLDADGD